MNATLNISKTIEERAINLILSGVEPTLAVKQAIDDENTLIEELIANSSKRSQKLRNQMCKNTYAIIHLKNAMA